jgi:hypothetical protein
MDRRFGSRHLTGCPTLPSTTKVACRCTARSDRKHRLACGWPVGLQMGTGLTSLVQVSKRGPNRTREIPVGVTIDTEAASADHGPQGVDHYAQLVVDIRS